MYTRATVWCVALTCRFAAMLSILLATSLTPTTLQAGPEFPAPAPRDGIVSRHAATGAPALVFAPNRGQADLATRFQARSAHGVISFSAEGAMLRLDAGTDGTAATLRILFDGANPAAEIAGLDPLPGIANFIHGSDTRAWRTGVPTYAGVQYHDLYPGITLEYRGHGGRLKATYVVQPGADPRQVRWRYDGAVATVDRASHDLLIRLAGVDVALREAAPVAWQTIGGEQQSVPIEYRVDSGGAAGFVLGHYDAQEPLIIDPELVYSTYLGGSKEDLGQRIAVDQLGNAYITGKTLSDNLPTVNAVDGSYGGGYDVLVAKINAAGTAFDYVTYLGGNKDDSGSDIAVDALGNVYLGGGTASTDFPVLNALQSQLPTVNGSGFVTKLSPEGSLIYSTYFGGNSRSRVNGIDVDADGYAYVAGDAGSIFAVGFPQVNPFGTGDAFIAKFDASGSKLVYSSMIGDTGSGGAFDVAVDWEGNAYVTGQTYSENFVTTPDAYQDECVDAAAGPCGGDAWVAKINRYGDGLVYSTFLGGYGADVGQGIAVNPDGTAVIVGTTTAQDFPTTGSSQQPGYGGGRSDVFVAMFNAQGSDLVYSTYLGGNNDENYFGAIPAIALDPEGNAVVAGNTGSTNFPTTGDAIKGSTRAGDVDGFVVKLDLTGKYIFSTLLGGIPSNASANDNDTAYGVAVDELGDMYVTGSTRSSGFPLKTPIQGNYGGGPSDAFLAKLTHGPAPVVRFEPNNVTFETLHVQSMSQLYPVTVYNEGDSPLTISSATLQGVNAQDFTLQAEPCTQSPIPVGETCALGVTFSPRASGWRFGRVAVTGPAWSGVRYIFLRGKGLPSISFNPSSLQFPITKRNTSSEPLGVTVTNVALEQLELGAVTVAGLNASEFAIQSDTCTNATIQPEGTCQVDVRFTPTVDGDRFARLDFAAQDFDAPEIVPLLGTGGATPGLVVEGLEWGICTGRTLTVRGSNFPKPLADGQGSYTVYFDGAVVASGTTDENGNFSTQIQVPEYVGATHVISAADMKVPAAKVTFPINAPVLRNDLPIILIPGVSGSVLKAASNFVYWSPPDPALALPIPDSRQLLPVSHGFAAGNTIWIDGLVVAGIFLGDYRVIDAIQLEKDGVTPKADMFGGRPNLTVGDILWNVDIGITKSDFYEKLRDYLLKNELNPDNSPRYRDSGPNRNLYYFPYDWRKDITPTAAALDALIDQALATSGKDKVVIIAHSMGGLVSRNYLLRRGGAKVDQLITLATPFLGSALVPNVLENGDDWGIGWHAGALGLGMHPAEMRKIAPNMTAAWELMLARGYFNADRLDPSFDPHVVVRSSLVDLVLQPEPLDYAQTMAFLGNKFNPELNRQAQTFRDQGIGDLSRLTDQVFHQRIIGSEEGTIGRMVYTPRRICGTVPILNVLVCLDLPELAIPRLDVSGDGTVPLHSAMGANYPDDHRYYIIPHVRHGPITSNATSLALIHEMIRGQRCSNQEPLPSTAEISGESLAAATLHPEVGASGAEILVLGSADLSIYDQQGNHTGIVPRTVVTNTGYNLEIGVPGSNYYWIDGGGAASLTQDGSYTLVVRGNQPQGAAMVRIGALSDGQTTQTIVFDGVAVTGSTVATFTLTLPGPVVSQSMSYKYDEQTPLQSIPQLPALTGDAANDLTAPTTQLSVSNDRTVTLSATDGGGSGVRRILYSLEIVPQHYVEYTGPFQLPGNAILTAFATDNAGNSEYPPVQYGEALFLPAVTAGP